MADELRNAGYTVLRPGSTPEHTAGSSGCDCGCHKYDRGAES